MIDSLQIRLRISLIALISALFFVVMPLHVQAEAVQLKTDHPNVYHVVKGDTLWDISSKFLDSPWQWPEIWHINQQIDNPHLIYPGDTLYLTYVDGKPRLSRDQGTSGVKLSSLPAPGQSETNIDGSSTKNGITKLSPKIRVKPLGEAIPAISLDAIQSYLSNTRVVEKEELDKAPYVVAGHEGHIILGVGDVVYARDPLLNWSESHESYGVYRGGREYIDPDTGLRLGYEARYVASVKLLENNEEVATFSILKSRNEVRINDRLLTSEERKLASVFYPKGPRMAVDGKIIDSVDGLNQVGKHDVVVLNLGHKDGLEEGHVLSVLRAGGTARDKIRNEIVSLPNKRAGLIIIFRVFDQLSYGLVLQSTLPIRVNDRVTNPSLSITGANPR